MAESKNITGLCFTDKCKEIFRKLTVPETFVPVPVDIKEKAAALLSDENKYGTICDVEVEQECVESAHSEPTGMNGPQFLLRTKFLLHTTKKKVELRTISSSYELSNDKFSIDGQTIYI
jgi:hypothetical protein